MAVLKRITGDAMRDEFSFIIDQHHPRGAAFASHTNYSTKLSQVANNAQQKITDAAYQPAQVTTKTTSTTTTTTTVQP